MKKTLILLITVITVITTLKFNSGAAVIEETGIMPFYNNAKSADVKLSVSSSGKATIKIICSGKEGVTSKITAVTYLQRKVGLIWVKVDNGLENKEWVDTVYTIDMNKTYTLQLEKTGTYRVKTEFTVKGTGGTSDVINLTATAEY